MISFSPLQQIAILQQFGFVMVIFTTIETMKNPKLENKYRINGSLVNSTTVINHICDLCK